MYFSAEELQKNLLISELQKNKSDLEFLQNGLVLCKENLKIWQSNLELYQKRSEDDLSLYQILFESRDRTRSIKIHYDKTWNYDNKYSHINICFDPLYKILTSVYLDDNDHQLKTGQGIKTFSLALYHEMLHWFHELQSPLRSTNEETRHIEKGTSEIDVSNLSSPLLKFYFNNKYIPVSKDYRKEIWIHKSDEDNTFFY